MNWENFSKELLETLDIQELSVKHIELVDEYNSITPLPRNYKVSVNDPWCAIYVSAMWHHYMYGWFPYECSCTRMLNIAKAEGKFRRESVDEGSAGWLIFYDWERDDSPDHVGYIIKVDNNHGCYKVIEGNYGNKVQGRTIAKGDRRIYGFIQLEYPNTETDAAKLWATKNRIILGDGTADSWTKPVTREQLAVILARYHQAT